MKKQITEQQIVQLGQQQLEQSIDNLDSSVVQHLQASRHKALRRQAVRHYSAQWASGFAVILIAFAVFFWQNNTQNSAISEGDFLLVEDMLPMEENQELLDELEFYQWLEQRGELV